MKRTENSYEIIDVSDITNVRFYTSIDQGSYIPPHWHRAVEIIYMQEGSLDITVESRSFTIHPGDCTLINANVLHSTKCTNPNKAIVLQIPLDFMEKYIPNVQQLLFQLYHNFSVKVFQSDLSQKKKDLDRLNVVLKYIADHYQRPISLAEISEIAYLQTGYFCRFFKKRMGVTFLEYQNEYRLSFIYRDLISTTDPVHVILERHGFTNYKLFRQMFQEHFGDTPTQIRRNYQKSEVSTSAM